MKADLKEFKKICDQKSADASFVSGDGEEDNGNDILVVAEGKDSIKNSWTLDFVCSYNYCWNED